MPVSTTPVTPLLVALPVVIRSTRGFSSTEREIALVLGLDDQGLVISSPQSFNSNSRAS